MNKDNVREQLAVHRHLTPRKILLSVPTYVFLKCACEKLSLEGDTSPMPKCSLVLPPEWLKRRILFNSLRYRVS